MNLKSYDYLIVGAGITAIVLAERLCTQKNKNILIVEKRDHIGGNCYDYINKAGVLIHKYGPHYFRTNSEKVLKYLSDFTSWHPFDYEIRAWTEKRFWNFPVNLNTFEQLIEKPSSTAEMEAWLKENRVPIANPKNSEEVILNQVGKELYEKFFLGYTQKQWRCHPTELDKSVCGRIPIRTNRDNRYLNDRFQALPKDGYTEMFNKMISSCGGKLKIILDCNYQKLSSSIRWNHMIYTGPIDCYYKYCFGKLPYRSLRFEHESYTPQEIVGLNNNFYGGYYQPTVQVNYPNDYKFTRIVEIKHATGQDCPNTTIVKEYPDDYSGFNEPYYPVPNTSSKAMFNNYRRLAIKEKNITFLGRLANYKYYNMDQVVALALKYTESK